ncbi:hypothetical protein C8J57DRAFT_992064, partial [Mycena rebaudengoi]
WWKMQQMYLEETMVQHGLGDSLTAPACGLCEHVQADGKSMSRCSECGSFLQCTACCLGRHSLTPLHFLEWTGMHWEKKTLYNIGLIYQIGHQGSHCRNPETTERVMVVIDTMGPHSIHHVRYRFCKCECSRHSDNLRQLLQTHWYPASQTDPTTCATFKVLALFRLLNVVANVNCHDYMHALERSTDPTVSTGMKALPTLMRMTRQYAFLQKLQRTGRAYDGGGIVATKLGECMVRCWACPQIDRNIPSDWQ